MEIQNLIQEATEKYISENLPAKIKENVTKMIDEIMDSTLRDFSPIGKQIKESINQSLSLELGNFKLLDYAGLITGAINSHLETLVKEQAIKPVIDLVNAHVGRITAKEITLEDLVNIFKKKAMKDSQDPSGEISCYVEQNQQYQWWTISIDTEEGIKKQECSIEIMVGTNGIFNFRTKNYWMDKREISPARLQSLKEAELEVFRLYASKSLVTELDEYVDVEWERDDNY